ncbi:MAG: glycosyltransferase family 9 protein [Candidatus Firestonebacteria bacterium]
MKILIIRLSSLGDVVLSTSVLPGLKKKFPDSFISFIVKKEYEEVLEGNPYVNEIISLDKKKRKLFNIIKLAIKLRKSYDYIIDLHLNFRSFLITLISSAKILKYKKSIFKRRILVFYSYVRTILPSLYHSPCSATGQVLPEMFKDYLGHVIKNYFFSLKKLNIKYEGELPEIFIRKGLTNELPQDEILIGLAPGGKWWTKRWLPERFAEAGDYFAKKLHSKILIFGDGKDKEIVKEIINLMKEKEKVLDFSGKTSVKELAFFIEKCTLFITNDSAPMHMALGLKVPTISIFCSTTPDFGFAISSPNNKILSFDLPCKPCNLHGSKKCWKRNFECAKKITVEEVIAEGEGLISR